MLPEWFTTAIRSYSREGAGTAASRAFDPEAEEGEAPLLLDGVGGEERDGSGEGEAGHPVRYLPMSRPLAGKLTKSWVSGERGWAWNRNKHHGCVLQT